MTTSGLLPSTTFELQVDQPRWRNELCVVAGTGPSIGKIDDLNEKLKGHHVIAVNDAHRLIPDAEVLYACDAIWWDHHQGVPDFAGEKWTSYDETPSQAKKPASVTRWGLKTVYGRHGIGFSSNPSMIHYGQNSGFQAINLAIHFGCTRIVLLGFDMRHGFGVHFFGDHPPNAGFKTKTDHSAFIRHFRDAVRTQPKHVRIVNANLDSGLDVYEKLPLEQALCL
jgi:hypothetical protein